ncbi:MAG: thioredoxin-dependent thiol peroxidase [Clostridia bacterium]|nr:thioredoxin-dependent thiol peroxidase [Clostridia bacterium]
MLKENSLAPDFTLPDSKGQARTLSEFRGKKVVLYFYSKAGTPGCTRQACAFGQAFDAFEEKNAAVIGVSKDSPAALSRFEEKHGLPFLLLSDADLTVSKSYEVWQEKKLYGKTSFGVVRSTYIINEEGIITHALYKVKPDENAEQVLALL